MKLKKVFCKPTGLRKCKLCKTADLSLLYLIYKLNVELIYVSLPVISVFDDDFIAKVLTAKITVIYSCHV